MSGFNSKQGHVWCLIAPPTIQGLLLPGSDCFSTLQGFDDNNNTLLCRRNLCLDFLSNLSFGVPPPAQLAISLIAHQMACPSPRGQRDPRVGKISDPPKGAPPKPPYRWARWAQLCREPVVLVDGLSRGSLQGASWYQTGDGQKHLRTPGSWGTGVQRNWGEEGGGTCVTGTAHTCCNSL